MEGKINKEGMASRAFEHPLWFMNEYYELSNGQNKMLEWVIEQTNV